MEKEELISLLLDSYNFIHINFDDSIKEKIIYPSIKFLEAKIDKLDYLNKKKILIIALLLLNKINKFKIPITPKILILTSAIIWHSTIKRPKEFEYIKQEDLDTDFDRSVSAARYLRQELGITEKKYENITQFYQKLEDALPLREQCKVNSVEIVTVDYEFLRDIIIKKIIKRKRAQSAIECVIFLYFNNAQNFTRNEIYYMVEDKINLSGPTPRATFNSDIGRYTKNAEVKVKRKPLLFTITNPNEKENKIQILDHIRNTIDSHVKSYKSGFLERIFSTEKLDSLLRDTKHIREVPKIIVMNINPENIENCIKYTIRGAKINTVSAGNVEKLKKGDICIIRRTSGGRRYKYGVVGIWYFYDKEDIEGIQEPLWIPTDVWKYKIIMKPLVKQFEALFEEDFTKDIPDQLRHKESTKVKDLIRTDIQGAVKINFRDPILPKRYLKAIIEEKRLECDINLDYEINDKVIQINVYNFLRTIVESKAESERHEIDYFIFVFNENFYEDESSLGNLFKFPEPDKGSYKYLGKFAGSWGKIIDNVKIGDKVIWTISGNSNRPDKKTFWGYGKIIDIVEESKFWRVESHEFEEKIKIDDVILKLPKNYQKLYKQSTEIINIGFYGSIQIDEFQYEFIYSNCKSGNKEYWICPKESCSQEKIILERNEDNIINIPSYEKVIIHFLQHLKEDNTYFGPVDIQDIFIQNTPKKILSLEEKGKSSDGETIWKNYIRSAFSELKNKGYLETDKKSDIPEVYNSNIKNRKDFRALKRTDQFLGEFKQYNDWELYKVPEEKKFKKIELKLIDSLPYPLASILWAYKAEINLEHRVDRLFNFFEALSQLISIILLSGFKMDLNFFKSVCISRKERDKEWYKRPSFSDWNQTSMWLSKSIRRLQHDKKNYRKLTRVFGNASKDFFDAITNKLLYKTLEEVREYRNIWKGHGGIVSEKETKGRLNILESKIIIIEEILSEIFTKFLLINPSTSEYIKKIYNYRVKVVMGTRRPFREIVIQTKIPMEKDMLYILFEGEMTPIELIPLVRLMESPKTEQIACYFYNRLDQNNSRWISYHFRTEAEIYKQNNEIITLFEFLHKH